jgi:hypothetical protein
MEFTFDTLSLRRLDDRAAFRIGRQLGSPTGHSAIPEGLLRPSFLRNEYVVDDQSVLAEGRREAKVIWGGTCPLQ